MKNLTFHFNPGAKYETRYQSGFQPNDYFNFVSFWECCSERKNHRFIAHDPSSLSATSSQLFTRSYPSTSIL